MYVQPEVQLESPAAPNKRAPSGSREMLHDFIPTTNDLATGDLVPFSVCNCVAVVKRQGNQTRKQAAKQRATTVRLRLPWAQTVNQPRHH